jgi:fatty-acid peroxygenase
MFYTDRFTRRRGAMPPTVLRLLQDKNSVQQLDGGFHRHRKTLFTKLLMGSESETSLVRIFTAEWLAALDDWQSRPDIVLFDEANLVLTRTVCRWIGIRLDDRREAFLARALTSMIENAGRVAPGVLLALFRRARCERFVRRIVRSARTQSASPTPLYEIVHFRDLDGELLSDEAATVEIINLLRPTVAVGRYIMFAALALHRYPSWREALLDGDDPHYERFAEEVRRFYPFFPVVGGVARYAFEWNGHVFKDGDWVLLDLYGTNHDARRFPEPDAFRPERGLSWRDQDHAFIPQGGGRTAETHRCPGEKFTVAIVREAIRFLVERMSYDVPDQDLEMPMNRIPARPKSGFILSDVRPSHASRHFRRRTARR